MSQPEAVIQNKWILANGARRDLMVWRNITGVFKMVRGDGIIKVGTPGAPDALGVEAVTITADMVGQTIGRAIAVEFKTATGRQSPEQARWQSAFEARGGLYRIVRE